MPAGGEQARAEIWGVRRRDSGARSALWRSHRPGVRGQLRRLCKGIEIHLEYTARPSLCSCCATCWPGKTGGLRPRRAWATLAAMLKKGATVHVDVHVDASPDTVYSAVSDVSRMGEWSPETINCEWLDGATGPAVGARFKGTNKRGIVKWSTKPAVVAANPGHEFTFEVDDAVRWTYRVEPDGTGTKLTESFEMLSDLSRFNAFAHRWVLRIKDRRADLERGMAATLARVKTVVESEVSGEG